MRSYTVQKVINSPDWDNIAKAPIDNILWRGCPEGLKAWAQLCYDDDFLKARLSAIEKEPLARFSGLLNMVHLDSCLEFFFRPFGNEGPYFNFEFNPLGTNFFGFGMDRSSIFRIVLEDYRERFKVNPFTIEGGWGIEFVIPVDLFKMFNSSFRFRSGLTTRGNFFKCGGETNIPHSLSWNPIESDKPDFHRPEFFGQILFA